MQYQTTLSKAIDILSSGKYLPYTMIRDLIDEGWDVPTLEKAYFRPTFA